ncbi:MAG: GrpB family protein, partial [Oscillospiraceae bacterium]|nr:GrpB family protein [Oscillospiraceae bacterium]
MRTMDVVPYDPNWKILYEQEKAILSAIFGDMIIRIEHFGSTSIEGIYAKPIIDIMVLVANINEIDLYNERMSAAGYSVRGENGIPSRRYFVRLNGDNQTHHIHVYQPDNAHVRDEVFFRDYLRANESARKEYSELKLALSKQFYTEPL